MRLNSDEMTTHTGIYAFLSQALLDLLADEDLAEIHATFELLDEDGSGSIDLDEIQRFLDREYQDEEVSSSQLNIQFLDKFQNQPDFFTLT